MILYLWKVLGLDLSHPCVPLEQALPDMLHAETQRRHQSHTSDDHPPWLGGWVGPV